MANFKCGAARSLPINQDRSWDGGAAAKSIFEANSDSEGNVTPGARRGFLVYNPGDGSQRDSYKLPFAMVIDGRLTALAGGIRSAASQLEKTDGLSDTVKKSALSILDGYMVRIHEDNSSEEEKSANGILLTRFNLQDRAMQQPHAREEIPEDMLAQIHDHSILEDEALPYITRAWASTDLIDSYHTRMRTSTLKNFAGDATAGISIQNSHRTNEQSLGRTFRGTYRAGRGDQPSRAEYDFYIPRNIQVADTRTNDLISAIRWGTARDVSVGFYGGGVRCSMCEKPMLTDLLSLMFFGGDDDQQEVRDPSAPCHHLPGVEYDMRDVEGRKTGERAMAIGEIEGAHCAELSIVFEGATPSAEITGRRSVGLDKAMRLMEMDVLTPRVAHALESRYRGVRFGRLSTRTFSGFELETEERKKRPDDSDEHGEDYDDSEDQEQKQSDEVEKQKKKGSREQETVATRSPDEELYPKGDNDAAREELTMAGDTERVEPHDDNTEVTPAVTVSESVPSIAAPAASERDLRGLLVRAGLAPEGFQGDLATRFRELATEITELRTWADVGQMARETLIEETRRAGVRAYGATGFKEAAYAPILQRGSWTEIVALRDQFNEVGAHRFQGGRATQDEDGKTAAGRENGHTEYRDIKLPARAFRA